MSTKWNLDPTHSEITFKVRHMMISNVKGEFKNFNVDLESEDENFKNVKANATIDTASISTNNTDRDNHLKSAEFFNAEAHPQITFETDSLNEEVTGNLTINGVTKPVKVTLIYRGSTVNPMSKKTTYGYQVLATLKRSDFGIGAKFTEAIISDLVRIKGDFELTEQ